MLIITRVFVTVKMILLFNIINYSQCESNNYCSSGLCNNSKQHIMCKFQSPGPASGCINYEKLLNTEKEKQIVLDRINSRRNKVSSGEIRSLPSAENMLKLEWSEELEVVAQRWADQCVNNFTDITDWCHDLENTAVGQTVGTIYGDAPGLTAPTLVDLWYMELLNMNVSYLPRYTPSSKTNSQHYDYFTQLIWAESSQVGCGGVKYKEANTKSYENRDRIVYKLICNFAPSGNVIGQAVYHGGIPCSRCPHSSHCDSKYQYLCSTFLNTATAKQVEFQSIKEYKHDIFTHDNLNNFGNTNEAQKTKVTAHLTLKEERSTIIPDMINENDTSFDFLSHLFDITSTYSPQLKQTTLPCKDILTVEEFIELLKKKLYNDQSLKDLLISSTKMLTPDPSFTDRTVAAIVDELYSKKETTTLNSPTHDQNINSTLLADLVEAVIFRHSDKFLTTEDISLHSQIAPNVNPIKIQAELGEIQANAEFTGHYFFPEEEEKSEPETTEIFDDLENSQISEISLEIDDLKINRETKDFLEEILESDLMTENGLMDQLFVNNTHAIYVNKTEKSLENIDLRKNRNYNKQEFKRIKRRFIDNYDMEENYRHDVFMKYNDLLKKLAADLRNLQMSEKFHCSSKHTIISTEKLRLFYYYLIIHSYLF